MTSQKHAIDAKDSIDALLSRIEELESINEDLERENEGLRKTVDQLEFDIDNCSSQLSIESESRVKELHVEVC